MGYCVWADTNERNKVYHDGEWGVPVHDDRKMFEHLILECMQCGLSWDLMLKKREVFLSCFDGFDYDKIAEYGEADIRRIIDTENMIKSPRKVAAVINNARCFRKIQEEFGSFCDYIWEYSDNKTILYNGHNKAGGKIPVSNGLSKRISKDLKKRGFKYVGEVTIYSHLQACGIINDHDEDCPCFKRINKMHPTVNKHRDKPVPKKGYPGCPNLTDGRYCPEHQQKVNSNYEKYGWDKATKKRYGRAWKRIRDKYAAEHPFCKLCFDRGIIVPTEEIYHKLPLSEGGTHDRSNLIAVCKSCHSTIHAKRGDYWGG